MSQLDGETLVVKPYWILLPRQHACLGSREDSLAGESRLVATPKLTATLGWCAANPRRQIQASPSTRRRPGLRDWSEVDASVFISHKVLIKLF